MKLEQKDEARLERSAAEIWAEAQALLKQKLKEPTLRTWIQPLRLLEVSEQEAVLAAANRYTCEWVSGKHFQDVRLAISAVVGRDVELRLVVDETIGNSASSYSPSIAGIAVAPPVKLENNSTISGAAEPRFDMQARVQASNLNPKYTLESFVVGSHNRFCHSAAMAVAERPGQTYNPLFIYGGVGLGKTHIMQAIGHHVSVKNPRLVVRYITCERFTNDLINSIRESKMIEFRKRYRQVDVLLVDDVHFIEGKESTQEEFFHTFNALRENGSQIVLSSDRPPKDIPKLEERLRSRFEWGLIADVQPPDLETRLAILRKKCELERMDVPDSVLEYIASAFVNNIRELEGALLRAHAYASLTGATLNLQTAASVLQIGTPISNKPNLNVENIIGAVAAHYRVETSDLRSKKRSQDLALPRHVAMYLAHDLLSMSHSRIGECFGDRAHTSVIYAINKIKEEMATDVQLSHAIQQLRRQLCS
jgi:chromosomal replication initiator protein